MAKDDITHMISHTHWDREWYIPFQNYRFRLVKMIDRCIDFFDNGVPFRHFNMDGQTIVIDDYLEIKPENRQKLKKYMQDGKIGIGPWYLQASPWLQTDEGIVRNLLMGKKTCDEFGVKPVNLGYVPDQFILFPMLPQVLQGFGIDHGAFSRGMNDQYDKYGIKSEFYWQSVDGSKVTMFHLKNGYGMCGFLPNNPLEALNVVAMARGQLEGIPRTTKQALMFNGSDHTDPDQVIPELIDIWNEEEELTEDFGILKQSSWQEFFDAFWAENPELKTISGEISGHKFNFAGKGVFSNRIPIKQENFALHYLLQNYSEPFGALNWTFGGEYPYGFIQTAWKYLLQNQAHDSIWAASPDAIIDDMWPRFRWTRQIADEVFRRSAHQIISRMKTKQIDSADNPPQNGNKKARKYYITVFNPSAWTRSGLISGTISVHPEDQNKVFCVRDCVGNLIPCKVIPRSADCEDRNHYRTFVPSHGSLPKSLLDFVFQAPNIPSLGYETFKFEIEVNDVSEEKIEETYVNGADDFLENSAIKVSVEKNGSITVIDKEGNQTYSGINVYADTGNRGGNYEYIAIEGDTPITTENCEATSTLNEANSAYSELKITIPWKIPASLNEDSSKRSSELVDYSLETYVRLYPGNNRRVDVKTEYINNAKWHQLKAIFPTNLKVDKEFVDGHFQISERTVDTPWDFEEPNGTTGVYPQHKFVGLYDSDIRRGLAILNKGLPAYETYRNEDKTVNVGLTLFRAQGKWVVHLNRVPNLNTPDAQWLGKKVINEYSIVPMKDDWLKSEIPKIADEFISPLRYEEHWDIFRLERYNPKVDLPPMYSLLKLIKGDVRISAVKRSDMEESLIIRLYSLSEETQEVAINVAGNVESAEFVDLKEEPLNAAEKEIYGEIKINNSAKCDPWMKKLELHSSELLFSLKPYKIATIAMKKNY